MRGASPRTERTLDDVFAAADCSDVPGLVVGVARDGEILYRRAFGLASVELGVNNTVTTRMRIASTSKQFTCLAALLLAEDGLLDVDAPVRTYLPELPALGPGPTVRQLMSHTSGYRCYLDLGLLTSGLTVQPKGTALATQIRQRDVNFWPGERTIYCNGGYHLLSIIIERTGGIPFEQFLKDRIFRPLNMTDTECAPTDGVLHERLATRHVSFAENTYRRGVFPSEELRGEGAMISTVDDMLRWLTHLRGEKRVGSDQTWAEMLTPARLNNGLVLPYCLGLMRTRYRGVETIHHGGSVPGGTCEMVTVPSHALDIIIMRNGDVGPAELASDVIDVVLADETLESARPKTPTEEFSMLVGRGYHASSTGFVVEFVDEAGTLGIRVMDSKPLPLHDAGETLRLDLEDLAIGPLEVDVAGLERDGVTPGTLEISEGGNCDRYTILPNEAPATAELAPAWIGTYDAADLGERAHITFDGNTLQLRIGGTFGTTLILHALSENVFAWHMADVRLPLRGVLQIERAGDSVSSFHLNTTRTRHLRFVRSP